MSSWSMYRWEFCAVGDVDLISVTFAFSIAFAFFLDSSPVFDSICAKCKNYKKWTEIWIFHGEIPFLNIESLMTVASSASFESDDDKLLILVDDFYLYSIHRLANNNQKHMRCKCVWQLRLALLTVDIQSEIELVSFDFTSEATIEFLFEIWLKSCQTSELLFKSFNCDRKRKITSSDFEIELCSRRTIKIKNLTSKSC